MEDEIITDIESTFDYLAERALEKFALGRSEHNEDLNKLDCFGELIDEIADMLIYVIIMRSQYEKQIRDIEKRLLKMQQASGAKGNGLNGAKRSVPRQRRKPNGGKGLY